MSQKEWMLNFDCFLISVREDHFNISPNLIAVCSRPTPLVPAKQWEEFMLIHAIVTKICKKQQGKKLLIRKIEDLLVSLSQDWILLGFFL